MTDQTHPLSVQSLLRCFALPADSRVNQRVPKKLLLEHGAPTAADKRLINEGIEEIQCLAALKPNTIGVAAYQDEQREYLEIAVVSLTLRSLEGKQAQTLRLAERLHRAVPYPLLLLIQNGSELLLTLAQKRWAQNEAGKVVLDGELSTARLPQDGVSRETASAFCQSLALNRQPQSHLKALYQGWIDKCDSLKAAALTGIFKAPTTPEQATARRHALLECERLEAEAHRLHTLASKEKQLARQVELNLAFKRVQTELDKHRGAL
ncbi:MAG: DUF4391 domain-containing protein [Sedimenticola sp.]|nr:MAG: DUF4391 domain-containing protein [Sedimenticola sp.]